MTTYVIKGPDGSALQQVQIGAADIVVLLGAAHTAWGWVGGLDGIRSIFSYYAGSVQKRLPAGFHLEVPPAQVHFLTMNGLRTFEDKGHTPFGTDPTTQIVGRTLCAIAHFYNGSQAVLIFMESMVPHLFPELEKVGGLKEGLQTQLLDNIDRITNEGAALGFDQLFLEASNSIPCGRRRGPNDPWSDHDYVCGVLAWIAKGSTPPYHTRSALAARVGLCLRSVGYPLAPVLTWPGDGDLEPPEHGQLVLVTGGVSETDWFRSVPGQVPVFQQNYHYKVQTVGSMLTNSLRSGDIKQISPETTQTWYWEIRKYLKQTIKCEWTSYINSNNRHIQARLIHTPNDADPSSWAKRLASVYFTQSSDIFAPCYDRIASEEMLQCVQELRDDHRDLLSFRIVTACVILSIAELISGDSFEKTRHMTDISFDTQDWLSNATKAIDMATRRSLPFWKATVLVAAVHTAGSWEALKDENEYSNSKRIIGARNGCYCVLPKLLTHMDPTENCLGLECLDIFLGGLPVHSQDHFIRESAQGPRAPLWPGVIGREMPFVPETLSEVVTGIGTPSQTSVAGTNTGEVLATRAVNDGHKPYIGHPKAEPPDMPLYLSIERPSHAGEPDLLLAARVDGNLIGYAFVSHIMATVAGSIELAERGPHSDCYIHGAPNVSNKSCDALNIRPSHWLGNIGVPRGIFRGPECLHVRGDRAWTLFAANSAAINDGKIVYKCFDCAFHGIGRKQTRMFIMWDEE